MIKVSRDIKKNNRGSALIVCIIVLLFVSILATVMLYMAGINYRMKKTDLNVTKSFYTGETPLETIQCNLLIPASEALNEAYAITNSFYAVYSTTDQRQNLFYQSYYESLKKLMMEQYGGSTIGSPYVETPLVVGGVDQNKALLVKNILHNLTYQNIDDGIAFGADPVLAGTDWYTNIYCNDGTVTGLTKASSYYATNPKAFIDDMAAATDGSGDLKYFTEDGVYLVVTGDFASASNADEIYDRFVQLYVIDPFTGNPVDEKDRRLIFKNVCVVIVKDGYRSVITTDIAIQIPPLSWNENSVTSEYSNWDMYQMIHYVNWSRS